ncbi:MAG: MFS transporter [Gammaproteobacteria bacterium]|nr:MFS transporter [Gammaproteobacteria bacterium]
MPWFYGWNVIAVAMLFQAVTFGIGLYSFTFWVSPLMVEFGASRGTVLFAVTITTLGIGVMAPFVGPALDRMSIRTLVCSGALVFATGLALMALTTSIWQVIVIYASLIAAGLILAGPIAGQTLAAKWFRGRRGLALGLVTVGTSIGGFLFPPIVTELLGSFGWRQAHLILAVAVLVIIIPPTWLVIRNSPEERGVAPEPESPASEAASAHFASSPWTTRRILSERTFWIMMIAFLGPTMAFGGIQQNLGPYTADLGISLQRAAYLMSVISATMIGGKIFFGSVADRWDNRYLYWIAVSALVLAILLMLGEPSYIGMLGICTLLGIAAGGFLPLMGAIVSTRFGPHAFGQVMGLLIPFLTLSAFGPSFAGWIRDIAGSYDVAWLVFLALLAPPVLAMALLPRKRV